MSYVLTQFSVKNFSQWKVVFDEFVPIRKHYSSKGARAFCVSNNPESVMVLTEFEDLERAIEMYVSKRLRLLNLNIATRIRSLNMIMMS